MALNEKDFELTHTTPCIFTKDTREMMREQSKNHASALAEVKGELRQLTTLVTNHLVHRLPAWVAIVFAVLTALIGGLVGRALF